MRVWWAGRAVVLSALLVLAAGCSLERTVGPRKALSARQAADAFEALSRVAGFKYQFADGRLIAAADPAAPTSALRMSWDVTENCPAGGWTRMNGLILGDQETGNILMDFDQTLGNCRSVSAVGREWTFAGEPAFHTVFSAMYNSANGTASVAGTIRGTMRLLSQGVDATCTVDIAISVTDDVGYFTGSLCGRSIAQPYR